MGRKEEFYIILMLDLITFNTPPMDNLSHLLIKVFGFVLILSGFIALSDNMRYYFSLPYDERSIKLTILIILPFALSSLIGFTSVFYTKIIEQSVFSLKIFQYNFEKLNKKNISWDSYFKSFKPETIKAVIGYVLLVEIVGGIIWIDLLFFAAYSSLLEGVLILLINFSAIYSIRLRSIICRQYIDFNHLQPMFEFCGQIGVIMSLGGFLLILDVILFSIFT